MVELGKNFQEHFNRYVKRYLPITLKNISAEYSKKVRY